MEIRIADEHDAEAIRAIYEPYVRDTAVSFEYEVPGITEFENRIKHTLEEYPYLAAVEDGKIVGYAYAGPFHPREAYKHSAELSIYIDLSYRQQGIGRQLYEKLEEILISQNVYLVHACIASPDHEDPYLTDDSERFHARMGFSPSGRHDRCGYKFGRWYSMIWMDKLIMDRPETPEKFVPFSVLRRRM